MITRREALKQIIGGLAFAMAPVGLLLPEEPLLIEPVRRYWQVGAQLGLVRPLQEIVLPPGAHRAVVASVEVEGNGVKMVLTVEGGQITLRDHSGGRSGSRHAPRDVLSLWVPR